jgi:hypothetical protein
MLTAPIKPRPGRLHLVHCRIWWEAGRPVRRSTNLAAEKAIGSMRYSIWNTAERGHLIRRLRVVGRRRGQPCREPHRQEG